MLKNCILIAFGGAIGSVLRYLTSVVTSKYMPMTFPLGTFLVNLVGCFLIGILSGYFLKNSQLSPDLRFLLITGFCGGFTTFSTFAQENIQLVQSGNLMTAILYTSLSVILGLTFVLIGMFLTK